ncbi:MAG: hypothetical protein WC405_05475 [Syntrophales bacterium]
MKNNPQRNKKFLTKAEYASYLEAMKQHAVDNPYDGVPSRFIPEE